MRRSSPLHRSRSYLHRSLGVTARRSGGIARTTSVMSSVLAVCGAEVRGRRWSSSAERLEGVSKAVVDTSIQRTMAARSLSHQRHPMIREGSTDLDTDLGVEVVLGTLAVTRWTLLGARAVPPSHTVPSDCTPPPELPTSSPIHVYPLLHPHRHPRSLHLDRRGLAWTQLVSEHVIPSGA